MLIYILTLVPWRWFNEEKSDYRRIVDNNYTSWRPISCLLVAKFVRTCRDIYDDMFLFFDIHYGD